MYNRYVRNDNGQYQRIPVQDNAPPPSGSYPPPPPPPPPDSGGYEPFSHGGGPQYNGGPQYGGGPHRGGPQYGGGPPPPPPKGENRRGGFLSGILSSLNLDHILDHIDTGDLLLLFILILLYKDGEDEELLIALGLLLIM